MAGPGPGRGPSLAGRFAAAIALTVAFYVLALAIAAGLLAVAILPWVWGHGNPFVSITGLVLGCTILVAIVPRGGRFTPPGVRVTHEGSRRSPPSSTTRRAAAVRRRRTRST
jgi:heat shock protein HtpX